MFRDDLANVMNAFSLSMRDVAFELEVAVSTVERWCAGTNRPHPILQKSYIDVLIQKGSETLPKILEMVGPDKQVTFLRYQSEELWYRCENGFEFPVPISDTNDAAFLPADRSMVFMRWIRKHLAMIEKARAEAKAVLVEDSKAPQIGVQ